MIDSFLAQLARTQRFRLGVPRSFQISPDGSRVAFLRSRRGADPLTGLWVLDVPTAGNAWSPTPPGSAPRAGHRCLA